MDAAAWGIPSGYQDAAGVWRDVSPDTVDALLAAMGASAADEPPAVATRIVSPGRCVLPAQPTWGWAVQLYALRSAASWGMGDLADLAELARWSADDLGAGMLLVNPLHAALPTPEQ